MQWDFQNVRILRKMSIHADLGKAPRAALIKPRGRLAAERSDGENEAENSAGAVSVASVSICRR
jgi:hypothetical protein